MNQAQHTIKVQLLDRDYQVMCPADEQDDLITSARFLDQKMREIRESGKVFGLDRIAVMAALNMAHELLGHRARSDGTNASIDRIVNAVDLALVQCREMSS